MPPLVAQCDNANSTIVAVTQTHPNRTQPKVTIQAPPKEGA